VYRENNINIKMHSQAFTTPPIIKLPPYGSQKRGLEDQEEAKYQLAIQHLQQELSSIQKEEERLKKETAEITKLAELTKNDHERQLKQEKVKLARMKAEEEKIQRELKAAPPQPQPDAVVAKLPAIKKEESKHPKP
jgi:hypothetical protein